MLFLKHSGFLILSFLMANMAVGQPITNYRNFTAWGYENNKQEKIIILRQFEKADQIYYFAVSPETLSTAVLSKDSLTIFPGSWDSIRTLFSSTPYLRALREAENYSLPLQDAGFTRFVPTQKGIDLTVDLCPSHRPLDRIVFTDLIHELGKIEKPVPVAISITGKWIDKHPEDLHWLDSLQESGQLNIVWINHSFNHPVSKTAPLSRNFLLEPGTDINAEVLNTEAALLGKGLLPSVFFRFPGLVSDKEIFDKIVDFGLIPVGSDAWLAKGQIPRKGSIVLIHANGNERTGVHDFINLLNQERAEVLSGHWILYDLRKSIVDTEQNTRRLKN